MSFIGVISSRKCFEKIKKELLNHIKEPTTFVLINLKSIQNIKNIKFQTIIVEDKLERFQDRQEALDRILQNSDYVLLNTDLNPKETMEQIEATIITYGLNRNATVTVSSISDTDILIFWQKSMKNKWGKKIEMEERRIKRKVKNTLKVEEILIIYTFLRIYHDSIIKEI